MKSLPAYLVCVIGSVLLACSMVSVAATSTQQIRQQQIRFAKGASSAIVSAKIKGDQTIDYLVHVDAGQLMSVSFKPSNLSAYFNILPPAKGEAIFIGSTLGNHFEDVVTVTGEYTIRVYLMRNAARRNETARYKLSVAIKEDVLSAASVSPPPGGMAFDKTFEWQGIQFHVTCANEGSINTLRIVPSGLEIDNSPIERTIDGTVSGAEVADINADGSPEIYVYIRSAGSGSYGSMIAYSANRRQSLSEIYIPSLGEHEGATNGYMGHDEFSVLEGAIGRRFPVYRGTDTNANPTGGMRQYQYKLKQGEANWNLQIDKTLDF